MDDDKNKRIEKRKKEKFDNMNVTCKFFLPSQVKSTPGSYRFRGPTLMPEMGSMVGQRALPSKTKTTTMFPSLTWLVPYPHYFASFSAFVYVTSTPLCFLLPLHHPLLFNFFLILLPFQPPLFVCFCSPI